MRLLQTIASNKLGGAEAFFSRLANSFATSTQLDQALLLRQDSPLLRDLQANHLCFQNTFRHSYDPMSRYRTQKIIHQWQPDIVLSWMSRASQQTGKRNKKFCHIARLGGYYNLKYYRHCDHLIGNTRGIVDYLIQQGVPAKQVHYISNFVNETPGKRLQRPETPLIVSLGRLHQHKAFDTLIQAMTLIPNATLWIAGTGPLEYSLKALAQSLQLNERVKFLGWHASPQDLIATADIFVCPSRHEPLGNVILEAFAQRTPIVATQSQGACELITPEHDGLLTPVDQPQALAAAIQRLIEQPNAAQKLAQAAYTTYQKAFNRETITQQYLELFQQVCR